jgi:lipoprotein-releasing system ATP-binding protein
MVIKAENLSKNYGPLTVLKGASLEVLAGEMVAIVGKSGSGKSTLLNILGTLDLQDSGSLFLHDRKMEGLTQNQLADFRNKEIGFVFQFHHLLPEFTALENVLMPAWIQNKVNNPEIDKKAVELLNRVGLKDRAHHKPAELSGGEQQRTAIARALMNSPSIIFADEPTGNLDDQNAIDLLELFLELRKELNTTFVLVTHNMEIAEKCDRIYVMKEGVISLLIQ